VFILVCASIELHYNLCSQLYKFIIFAVLIIGGNKIVAVLQVSSYLYSTINNIRCLDGMKLEEQYNKSFTLNECYYWKQINIS
jgi:hypothetical protein